MMQVGLYGLFGFSLAALVTTFTGVSAPCGRPAWSGGKWSPRSVRNSVDLSAKVLGVLVALEFLVVAPSSPCWLWLKAPEGVSTETVDPGHFFTSGVGVLLAFGIAFAWASVRGDLLEEPGTPGEPWPVPPTRRWDNAMLLRLLRVGPVRGHRPLPPSWMPHASPVLIWSSCGSPASPLLTAWRTSCSSTSLLAALVAFHRRHHTVALRTGTHRRDPRSLGVASPTGRPRRAPSRRRRGGSS
ncbi:hypothetical protein QJS66_13320 [Kocuria rhizophila]|nr:hypothetical protein QJS66_13320 [Kocuria rhizophila]